MGVDKLTPLQGIVILGLFMDMLFFSSCANGRALDYMGRSICIPIAMDRSLD